MREKNGKVFSWGVKVWGGGLYRVCESEFACLPGYMFIISRLPGFDAYLESSLISSGHYYMSGQETDTHTRQRNIPGPAGAIYLLPSRFKILIKINLPQFTHSAICLFIRITLIISVGRRIITHLVRNLYYHSELNNFCILFRMNSLLRDIFAARSGKIGGQIHNRSV